MSCLDQSEGQSERSPDSWRLTAVLFVFSFQGDNLGGHEALAPRLLDNNCRRFGRVGEGGLGYGKKKLFILLIGLHRWAPFFHFHPSLLLSSP